jgi:hypothetical protein
MSEPQSLFVQFKFAYLFAGVGASSNLASPSTRAINHGASGYVLL